MFNCINQWRLISKIWWGANMYSMIASGLKILSKKLTSRNIIFKYRNVTSCNISVPSRKPYFEATFIIWVDDSNFLTLSFYWLSNQRKMWHIYLTLIYTIFIVIRGLLLHYLFFCQGNPFFVLFFCFLTNFFDIMKNWR